MSSISCNQIQMAAIPSLVNAYELKAGMVCLQCKNCVIRTWALQWWDSFDGAHLYVFTSHVCVYTARLVSTSTTWRRRRVQQRPHSVLRPRHSYRLPRRQGPPLSHYVIRDSLHLEIFCHATYLHTYVTAAFRQSIKFWVFCARRRIMYVSYFWCICSS